MSRVKTFDSTGSAPNGRIYAGDLNAIQDQYADLYNLAQAVGVVSLTIGESGLTLSRYGAGVMGLAGALRATGKLNGVGGLQVNGTDLASTHLTDGSTLAHQSDIAAIFPPGAMLEYGGASAPTGFLLCQGQEVSRSTYAALYAALGGGSSPWGQGNGTSTFNVPNRMGRVGVGKASSGTFATLAGTGGAEAHTLVTGELPVHSHSISSDSAGTPAGSVSSESAGTPAGSISSVTAGTPSGSVTVNNAAAINTGNESADHVHYGTTDSAGAHTHGIQVFTGTGEVDVGYGGVTLAGTYTTPSAGAHTHTFTTGGRSAAHYHTLPIHGHSASFAGNQLATHTHSFTGSALSAHGHTFTGSALGTHTHTIGNAGSGTAHNNLQPYVVVNYIIKT